MIQFFGLLAGFIGVVGYIPYIRDILHRRTKPDRSSWLIWMFQYSILFVTQLMSGGTGSLWLVGAHLLGITCVFGLSLKFGVGVFNTKNKIIFACIGIALLLWYATNDPVVAMILSLTIHAVASALTIVKVYKKPMSETISLWVMHGAAGMLGILSVDPRSSKVLYLYPVCSGILCFMVAAVAMYRRRVKRQISDISVAAEA